MALNSIIPTQVGGKRRLGPFRAVLGALFGIAVAGALTRLLESGYDPALPFLVAPLGASAVLVFAVPASPLAQPWSVFGGNVLSAAVGLSVGRLIGDPWLAGSVAVALAIAVMTMTRSLHPPGGACALLCALGATGTPAWGWEHLVPFVFNVGALCFVGWIYNNATDHPWPHHATPVKHQPGEPYKREDIDALLAEWDETLDVDADDLDAFVQALLKRGAARG
ncbi:CBS domain-containing membrane protein [Novosphingobium sp. PhB165]|uniref:HPP family protein n=1 Tax=Novosphingobium sp. PhB165 TaxID=2485105 RepID=UPI0010E95187|nr:HPP family protein [Novosphingobium sp. PhB165]TCM17305.1 CBS domain-containing membrane protein [Novosphingobium sp. PhB165]